MSNKISKEELLKIECRVRREIAIENGYYDYPKVIFRIENGSFRGRNAPKIVSDKKKEKNKQYCRGKKNEDE